MSHRPLEPEPDLGRQFWRDSLFVPVDRSGPSRVPLRRPRRLRDRLERSGAAIESTDPTHGAASDPASDEERTDHARHRPHRRPRA